MRSLLKFLAAALILSAIIHLWRTGKLNTFNEGDPEGKLLGLIPDQNGYGAYEFGLGVILAGGLWAGGAALRAVRLGRFAPAAQAPA